jgi:hypothetical protein
VEFRAGKGKRDYKEKEQGNGKGREEGKRVGRKGK